MNALTVDGSDAAGWWLGLLFDAALKGLVILALAGLAARVMRRGSAATKHLIWFLALGSLLLLPALGAWLPGLHVLPDWTGRLGRSHASLDATLVDTPAGPMAVSQLLDQLAEARILDEPDAFPAAGELDGVQVAPVQGRDPEAAWLGHPAQANQVADQGARPPAGRWRPSRPLNPETVVFGLWLLGALLALLPAFAGSLSLRRLERRARRMAGEDWGALLEAVRQRLGLRRRVALLVSPERDMPMAWGCWRPKVLLPCEAENWSEAKRRMVLLHELAHVRRWDCLTKLVARVVCAAYWFNPLVWLAARRLAAEREQACDDLVLSAGMRAPDYAEQLVAIAGALQSARLAELGAIPMARPSKLGQRVRAILDPRRSRAGLTLTKVLVAVVAVASAVVPLGMLRHVAQAADPAAPAAPPAGGEPMRHFVRLVVGPTSLTLEGREVTWEQLPDLLRKIPDRSRTVLEIAASTDQLTLAQFEPARDQAGNLARDLGFEYLSYVGIHPLGSKGSPPAKAAPPATTPEASAGAQASEAEFRAKLNEDQRAVAEWTGRQFRSFLDHRTYAGLSAPERADLETRLVDSLEGPKNRAYYEAINSLGALRSRKAVAPLLKIAAERIEKDNRDRWMAIRALGLIGDQSVVPEMVHLTYHPNVNTRWWAQLTLVRLTGQNFGKDWEAWGRWWNAQGGQPPFTPEKVTWTANPDWGSPEALEAGDRKFLDDLKQRGFGREESALSPRSAVEAAEMRPVASSSAAEPEPPAGLTGAIVLKRDGGVTAGKRSLGASGHAVQFARPGGARFVEAVYIFASR